MKPGLDVNHINPFLQSTITIFESVAQTKPAVGKPVVASLDFHDATFVIQVGVTGELKGQVLIVMTVDNAKAVASKMMMGMPVNELDEMATSALSELGNMIMGNTATIFSTLNTHIDITPPMAVMGTQLRLASDIQALKIPMICDGEELFSLYICVAQN